MDGKPWDIDMEKKKKSGPPSVPNFGRDGDINDSLANLKS